LSVTTLVLNHRHPSDAERPFLRRPRDPEKNSKGYGDWWNGDEDTPLQPMRWISDGHPMTVDRAAAKGEAAIRTLPAAITTR
jgi:hypothetical protein